MLHLGLLSLLILAQAAAVQEPVEPPKPQEVYDEGPLRIEISAMREIRLVYEDMPDRSEKESNFAMQVRIRGERLGEISRYGMLILEELVDSTGHSLLDPNTYTEEDLERTREMTFPVQRLKETGLQLVSKPTKLAKREAAQLKTVRGYVRLILADQTKSFTVLNPEQYRGKVIADERLAELGVEVRVAEPTEFEQGPPTDQALIFEYTKKGEHIRTVKFFDPWMRPLRHRERPMTTTDGKECMAYYFRPGEINDDMQVVFEVHPKIEDVRLPLEVEDVALP